MYYRNHTTIANNFKKNKINKIETLNNFEVVHYQEMYVLYMVIENRNNSPTRKLKITNIGKNSTLAKIIFI